MIHQNLPNPCEIADYGKSKGTSGEKREYELMKTCLEKS